MAQVKQSSGYADEWLKARGFRVSGLMPDGFEVNRSCPGVPATITLTYFLRSDELADLPLEEPCNA